MPDLVALVLTEKDRVTFEKAHDLHKDLRTRTAELLSVPVETVALWTVVASGTDNAPRFRLNATGRWTAVRSRKKDQWANTLVEGLRSARDDKANSKKLRKLLEKAEVFVALPTGAFMTVKPS